MVFAHVLAVCVFWFVLGASMGQGGKNHLFVFHIYPYNFDSNICLF